MCPEGSVTLSDMVNLLIQPTTEQWPQHILELRTGALKMFYGVWTRWQFVMVLDW